MSEQASQETALAVIPAASECAPTARPVATVIAEPIYAEPIYDDEPRERGSRNALFRRPQAPVRKRPPQRNVAPRRRNASAAAALPPARVAKGDVKARAATETSATEKTGAQRLGEVGYTAAASMVASLGGALAARWGFHPMWVSGGLGVIGGIGGWRAKGELSRQIFSGIASAGISQIALMGLAKSTEPPKLPAPAPVLALPPAPPPSPSRLKNADLGTLPTGVLDAAFERARAELAMQHDGAHGVEHGAPIPFVPFVP